MSTTDAHAGSVEAPAEIVSTCTTRYTAVLSHICRDGDIMKSASPAELGGSAILLPLLIFVTIRRKFIALEDALLAPLHCTCEPKM